MTSLAKTFLYTPEKFLYEMYKGINALFFGGGGANFGIGQETHLGFKGDHLGEVWPGYVVHIRAGGSTVNSTSTMRGSTTKILLIRFLKEQPAINK